MQPARRRAHGTVARLLVAAVVFASVTTAVPFVPAPASAAGSNGSANDPYAEREAVRSQRAALASQIDTLEADDAAIDRALGDLEANVRAEQLQLDDARRRASEAIQRAFESQAAADDKQREVDDLQERMSVLAVEAYVNPPGHDLLEQLKAPTANEAAEKEALLATRASRASDVLDQLRAARAALEDERAAAERATVEADEQARDAEARLAEYETARAQQQEFAAGLDGRLNAKLAEADALASVDAELASQIVADQAALASRLRAMAPPVADPAVAPTPVGPTPGPTPTPNPTPTPTPPPTPPPPPQPAPPLTTVRGITVATSIAGQLDAMLGAAASAGITLGGSGYRDINRQIELRRAHCGTSYYAIYEMPAMLCTPPTAIPGLSMHEKGLAVDFTWNGRAITSRDSPAFQWLAANAGRYGFINLPSEPWHWSVSGR
jgi:hypothetical protein